MEVIWGRGPEQGSFPLDGESTGGRLENVSVVWQPNVKIEMAFKADNELVPNLFLSQREALLIFSILQDYSTGKIGGFYVVALENLHPMLVSPSCRPQGTHSTRS